MENSDLLFLIFQKKKRLEELQNEIKQNEFDSVKTKEQVINSFIYPLKEYFNGQANQKLKNVCYNYSYLIGKSMNTYTVSQKPVQVIGYNDENAFDVILKCRDTFESSASNLLRNNDNCEENLYLFLQAYFTMNQFINDTGFIDRKYGIKHELINEAKELENEITQLQNKIDSIGLDNILNKYNNSLDLFNKVSLGYEHIDIDLEKKELFENKYNISNIDRVPLYLSPKENEANLFININEEMNDDTVVSLRTFLNNMYFGSLGNFNDVSLKICGIESDQLRVKCLETIFQKMDELSLETEGKVDVGFLKYKNLISCSDKNTDGALRLFKLLTKEMDNRKSDYGENDKVLNDFNIDPKNKYIKKDYILCVINGFNKVINTLELRKELSLLIKDGYRFGLFFLLIGENKELEKQYNEIVPALDLDELGIKSVDFANLIQDRNVSKESSFDTMKDKEKEINERSTMYFDDMYTGYRENDDSIGSSISIPVGLNNGQLYSMVLNSNEAPGCFIVGKSRSGKSAFIHTFILSICKKYRPEEVSLYLIDFKAKTSTTFYKYKKGEELYLPNIKYLSFSDSLEDAKNLVFMVKDEFDRRQALQTQAGVDKFENYNRYLVSRGMERMPLALFIIDEYNNFMDVANEDRDADLVKNLFGNLRLLASVGIKLIFSGQNIAFKQDYLAQFSNRISFDPGDIYDSVFNTMVPNISTSKGSSDNGNGGVDYTRNDRMYSMIHGKKGYAFFVHDRDGEQEINLIRTSFAGDIGTSRIINTANEIKKKYTKEELDNYKQIMVGSDELAKIDDYYESYKKDSVEEESDKKAAYEENGYEAPINKLYLPIGISSSNYQVKNVVFNNKEFGNMYALANNSYLIEENIILSYLSKVNKNVTYIQFDMKNKENPYSIDKEDVYDLIDCYNVKKCSDKKSVLVQGAIKIQEIYKEHYEKRIDGEEDIDDKMLLIIHQISDYQDLDRFVTKYNEELDSNKDKEDNKSSNEEKEEFLTLEQALEMGFTKEMYETLYLPTYNNDKFENKHIDSNEINQRNITKMLEELFRKGAEYGIYVLYTNNAINNYIESIISVRDDKQHENNILALDKSFYHSCLVNPGIRVLLFDTKQDSASKLINEIRRKYNE